MAAFDVRAYLKKQKSAIDRVMGGYLEPCGKRSPALHRAMRYGVFSGGKRIRPILTLASGEAFGGKRKALLPFACALELIHTYSIIHDDLPAMDNDDFRRGRPANHKVFGEGVALLAGDALLTEAFCLLSRPELKRELEPALILDLTHEIARASGMQGMVGGQAIDLDAEGRRVGLKTVTSIHELKTGALILTAVSVGAQIAGAGAGVLKQVRRYGRYLGLAFQIADDIVDAENVDSHGSGSSDRDRSKATYPSVVGLKGAKERVRELTRLGLGQLRDLGPAAEPLRGIAGYVLEQALSGHKKASERLERRIHIG